MKYLAKEYIWEIISYFLTLVFTVVLSIFFHNPLILLIVFLVSLLFYVYLFSKIKEWYPKRILKSLKEKYDFYKTKDNPTLFEQLYVKAYNDSANDIMKKILSNNKIKHIINLDFDISNDKSIDLSFEYNKHSVYYHLYEDKVEYYIDSPLKYDHLEYNKEYEKTKEIIIDMNSYESIESYLLCLMPNIIENINSVEAFEENAAIININNDTFKSILDFKDFRKTMAILLNIMALVLIIVSSLLTYFAFVDFLDSYKNSGGYQLIFLVLIIGSFDLFVIFAYFISIYEFIEIKKLNKDIKQQNVSKITGKPYKIKFLNQALGGIKYRRAIRFCSGIKLYFNESRHLKLTYVGYMRFLNKEERNKIKEKLMSKSLELEYYKNSKIITYGEEPIDKAIKRSL